MRRLTQTLAVRAGLALLPLLLAVPAFADDAPAAAAAAPAAAAAAAAAVTKIDSGDTAWMLTSTALVLMMTIPGLALFYAGMVRKKNILATLMQSFAICCLVTVTWMVAGYSLAFTNGNAYIGDLSRFFLMGFGQNWDQAFKLGAGVDSATQYTVPESVYMMFQMTFAIITPALIAGAFADRMKFSAMMWFIGLWSLFVYSPIAHWVWSATGWLAAGVFGLPGAADFAGGTVVHINAGVAGLVAALVLGKRVGYGNDNMAPYNVSYAVIGASLLWVGWFGFNAGSAVAANGRAGMAMTVTQIATAAAALAWMFAEWGTKGKPSVLGAASGAVAGLVAITPASGFVLPGPALIIGIAAGAICFWSATSLKHALGYDDSLDAFGVHGVGGIIGALLTGVFAFQPLSGTFDEKTHAWTGGAVGGLPQFEAQVVAVLATLIWSGVISFVLFKVVDVVVGLRVSEEEEREGLDVVLHGERLG
ncbi:MAG TPA: ammonium transporter [Acetobacteraceae bacterium]|nr:ammonium transporter [Acetobacteraceae bacterium]